MLIVAIAGLQAQLLLVHGRWATAEDFQASPWSDDVSMIKGCARVVTDEHGDAILDQVERRVRSLVLEHRDAITRVAEELLRRRFLTAEDLDAILGPMTFSNEMDGDEFLGVLRAHGVPVGVVRDY